MNNLTNKEIEWLRKDPNFFGVKGLNFQDKILKQRKLTEVIISEDLKENEIVKLKENILKTSKASELR